METNFKNFLYDRNDQFIDIFSSESAIWLMDTLRRRKERPEKRKCVLVSFEPPIASPPIVFNWNEDDIWYVSNVESNPKFYEMIHDLISKSEHPFIIFLEKKNSKIKERIESFIKGFESRGMDIKFFLAEYISPLTRVNITTIPGGKV